MKLADLLADKGKLTNRLTVPVLMDTDAAERCARAEKAVEQAQATLDRARQSEDGMLSKPATTAAQAVLDAAQAELEAANDAAAGHLVEFVVQSVGSDQWEELVTSHPPTEEQRKEFENAARKPEWDPKTFQPAAVAACLVEPELDGLDDARKLKASVPDVVWQQLFIAVLRVNRGQTRVPLSLTGSGATRNTGAGSAQP